MTEFYVDKTNYICYYLKNTILFVFSYRIGLSGTKFVSSNVKKIIGQESNIFFLDFDNMLYFHYYKYEDKMLRTDSNEFHMIDFYRSQSQWIQLFDNVKNIHYFYDKIYYTTPENELKVAYFTNIRRLTNYDNKYIDFPLLEFKHITISSYVARMDDLNVYSVFKRYGYFGDKLKEEFDDCEIINHRYNSSYIYYLVL